MNFSQEVKDSRILIIDDEPVNINILQELFELEGFSDITGEPDPVKAVEHYKNEDFDIILLDINMPVLNGFDVMEKLKAFNKASPPPILILTAQHDNNIRIRALKSGASDFLTKPFNDEEVISRVNNLLKMHLGHKSLAIFNQELEKRVAHRTKELTLLTEELLLNQQEALACLGLAAEYRDMDTASHTIRVGWYSRLLGEKIGIAGNELELLFQAAPMHDVGKIGIPDKILLKPGKFEPDEWKIMQSHTEIGGKILEQNSSILMVTAKEIAICHHEKWDGSGYPNNLAGNDIPINARVVILADVFDALTIERPYKKAWKIDKAIDYIESEAGTFFDPEIVKAFTSSIPEFLKVREEFHD